MSNNTEYKLTLLKVRNFNWRPHNAIAIIADLRFFSEDAMYAIDNNGKCNNLCDWREYESELTEFSKRYPDVLFTLDIFDEESGDIRRDYFHNGNHQKAVVNETYSKFEVKQ